MVRFSNHVLCERYSEFGCDPAALCAADVDLAGALRYALVNNRRSVYREERTCSKEKSSSLPAAAKASATGEDLDETVRVPLEALVGAPERIERVAAFIVEHWEKRRRAGLQYPSATSVAELHQLIDRYGDQRLKANADAIMNSLDAFRPECSLEELGRPEHVSDDFETVGINSKEDVRAVFSGNFYFGCEADDRATMWAFDPRMGVRLRPVFSSDFTHFDVPDFREVIPEAFEMVEKGFVTEQDFREFTFTNAARLHTGNNPGFFKGTVIEQAVANELGLKS